ncbi:hypothetical protein PR202_gb11092 [Eleusine coracana subsp. coracana]|uniref:16S rRNA (uracil(1498)-N(3))-methyltransferase n=1 Tax=Eleusine coracana subsp. coracana TaxID=191504 RepID=A0AAV5EJB9_ELECO|nr:hypothetical protein PR202_gb11092 [Eleusine coracana subsp. coracana]
MCSKLMLFGCCSLILRKPVPAGRRFHPPRRGASPPELRRRLLGPSFAAGDQAMPQRCLPLLPSPPPSRRFSAYARPGHGASSSPPRRARTAGPQAPRSRWVAAVPHPVSPVLQDPWLHCSCITELDTKFQGEVVRVQGDEYWHMTRVLRLGVSDRDPERWTCRLAYREMYCQRIHEMSLKPPIPIGKVLPVVSQSRLAFLASAEAPPLLSVLPKSSSEQSGLLIIGPEGDFTEEEVHALKAAGAVPVGLGPCRLRVETAQFHSYLLSCYGRMLNTRKHRNVGLIVDISYITHGLLIDMDYKKDE